jgi:hypothetical protein
MPSNTMYWPSIIGGLSGLHGIKSSDGPNQEVIAIDSLTLEQYHQICYWNLSRFRKVDCSASATVNLDTIIACPLGDRLEDSVEIALLPDVEVYLSGWGTPKRTTREVMEGGWTRYYEFILAAW